MGDKVRGTIAIVVGCYALWQSYISFRVRGSDWHLWLLAIAGLLLVAIGTWRVRRKPVDLTSELLK